MNENKFMSEFLDGLREHLAQPKTFIQNLPRLVQINEAMQKAKQLFPDAKIYIEDDPLQTGSVYLCIESFDLFIRETEIVTLGEIVCNANNIEIYADEDKNACIALLFQDALIRID